MPTLVNRGYGASFFWDGRIPTLEQQVLEPIRNPKELDMTVRLLFDFFIHEAENAHNRVDWSLIFHGILFEAFFAAHYPPHRIAIGLLGCLVSYVWLVAGIRQLWNLGHLVKSTSDIIIGPEAGDLFRRLFEARQQYQPVWMKWARATPAFCIVLPIAVLVAWLVVTATATECAVRLWGLAGAMATLLVFTGLWAIVQPGPKISPQAIAHLHRDSV